MKANVDPPFLQQVLNPGQKCPGKSYFLPVGLRNGNMYFKFGQ
jgi:hypothetical protein